MRGLRGDGIAYPWGERPPGGRARFGRVKYNTPLCEVPCAHYKQSEGERAGERERERERGRERERESTPSGHCVPAPGLKPGHERSRVLLAARPRAFPNR